MDTLVGKHIRGYEIIELLGAGGFGAVYKATQPDLRREVAIKVILPHYAVKPEFKQRFESEAQLIAQLQHPYIVPLHDYWQDEAGAFLVMRLIKGGSLRQRLRQDDLIALKEIIRIYEQLGSALAVAHEANVVHRDIKPDNILLDEIGNAYLSDFGIAKNLKADLHLTTANQVIGTGSYSAPEQIRNQPVTAQTDIFALGIMLYELSTGTVPFEDFIDNLSEALPSVLELEPTLPPALDRVIARATAKDAADRYLDVREMVEALRDTSASIAPAVNPVEVQLLPIGPKRHIFISYARGDKGFVQRLIADLENEAISVWVDHQNLKPGTRNWEKAIRTGLKQSRALIYVGSERARESNYVQDEISIAEMEGCTLLAAWAAGEDGRWLDCVPLGYGKLQYVDMRGAKYPVGFPALLEGLRTESAQPVILLFDTPLQAKTEAVHTLPDTLPQTKAADAAPVRNPYKALDAFTEADAADFFGRDALIATLRQRLDTFPAFLAVIGASGSGKSSVVMAGLTPHLRREHPEWLTLPPVKPGAHPIEALAVTLQQAHFPQSSVSAVQEDLERGDTRGLLMRAATIPRAPKARVVLFVDQFEEVFTQAVSQQEREQFLNLLTTAATDSASAVTVILTLRADFLDRILSDSELGRLIQEHGEYVLPMSITDLKQTIERPAESAGLIFEDGLVGDLVFEARDQVGGLPLLQFALDLLFQRREGLHLTRAAYEALGGVRGSLAQHAETTYSQLPDEEHRTLTRSLFLRLIEPGATEQDTTRRRAHLSELTLTDAAKTERLRRCAETFVRARLLTTDSAAGEETIEVSHEALLHEWIALRKWVETSRADVRLQRLLAGGVAEWVGTGRSHSFLLTGGRLAQFEEWAATTDLALTSDERAFIDASLAEHDRQAAIEAKRKTREDTLQRRAMERLRAAIALGLFLVVALGLSLLAFNQSSLAQHRAAESHSLTLALDADQAMDNDNPDLALALALASLQAVQPPLAESERTLSQIAYALIPTRRYVGHQSRVYGLAVSPDGKTVASASFDHTIIFWDIETGAEIRHFEGHEARVYSVAFSPDGDLLASGALDRTLRLWDVATGEERWRVDAFEDGVRAVAFSPDGRMILTGSLDGTLRLWDAETGAEARRFTNQEGRVFSVAFSPDGSIIASGTENIVQLWNSETGELMAELVGHEAELTGVAFSPDGSKLASASDDRTVRLWDVTTGEELKRYQGHTDEVKAIAFSADGRRLLSGGRDSTMLLWDIETGRQLGRFIGHTDELSAVVFLPGDRRTLSASFDGTLALWNLTPAAEIVRFEGFSNTVNSVQFSPDGTAVLATSDTDDRAIHLLDVATGEEIRRYEGHERQINIADFNPDGTTFVSSSNDATARLWDVATGEEIQRFEGHEGIVWSVAFASDGTRIATASQDATVRVWDVATGEEIQRFTNQEGRVWSVAFSPDGSLIAFGDEAGKVVLWNPENGEIIHQLAGHTDPVKSVAFSPDGKMVVSGSDDNTLRLWDTQNGSLVRIFRGHNKDVASVAFSPDGQYIASASDDRTVRLWNVSTGDEVRRFSGHTGDVLSVAFSPDGSSLVTGSEDGTARVWIVHSRDELIEWTLSHRYVRDLTCDERLRYKVEPYCTADSQS